MNVTTLGPRVMAGPILLRYFFLKLSGFYAPYKGEHGGE
jgi:hypothetical protein